MNMDKNEKKKTEKRCLHQNVKIQIGKNILKDLDAEIKFCNERQKMYLRDRNNEDFDFIEGIFLEGDNSVYGVLKELLNKQIGDILIKLVRASYFGRFILKKNTTKKFDGSFIFNVIIATLLDNHLKLYQYLKFLIYMLKFYHSYERKLLKNYIFYCLVSFDKLTREYILINLFLVSNYTRICYILYDFQHEIRRFAEQGSEEIFVENAKNYLNYRKNLSQKILKCELTTSQREMQILNLINKIFELTNEIIDKLFTFRKRCVQSAKKNAVDLRNLINGYTNAIPVVYENYEKFLKIKENMTKLVDKFNNKNVVLRNGYVVEETLIRSDSTRLNSVT